MRYFAVILFFVVSYANTANADEKRLPPLPKWKPSIAAPLSEQLGRMVYYTDNGKDIAQFTNGTMVVLPDGLNDDDARSYALDVVSKIYHYHPDMHPLNMDDGNILVQYNHPAYNIVISKFAEKHMEVIEKNHLDALAESEILITSLGYNKFGDFEKKALYGRTFMFMDAQNPKIIKIYRHNPSNKGK